MGFRRLACVTVLAAAVLTPIAAQAFDDSKYPDLKGEWRRVAVPSGRYRGRSIRSAQAVRSRRSRRR